MLGPALSQMLNRLSALPTRTVVQQSIFDELNAMSAGTSIDDTSMGIGSTRMAAQPHNVGLFAGVTTRPRTELPDAMTGLPPPTATKFCPCCGWKL